MKEIDLPPKPSSSAQSYRDIGYTLEIAIADLVDNSVSAGSKNIDICFKDDNDTLKLSILDDGFGMNSEQLIEAMRLATKDPTDQRDAGDLGRFGLGLKTASFSQCKLLTVISKTKKNEINIAQWDLEKVFQTDRWVLNSLEVTELPKDILLLNKFNELDSGTLVSWDEMDRISIEEVASKVTKISDHLSLMFHRFLSGEARLSQVHIKLNGVMLEPFDPMAKDNPETLFEEPITVEINRKKVRMQACILPSSKKTNKSTFEKNAGSGYSKSQGCYVYRADRLIRGGDWLGIIRKHDSNNLVRIQVDIGNDQDREWNITINKSGFKVTPPLGVRSDLRAVIKSATKVGRGVIGGRKRTIKNKTKIMFWNIVKYSDDRFGYSINKEHPLYEELINSIDENHLELLDIYLRELQKYLPVEDINRSLIHTPHDFDQKNSATVSKEDLQNLVKKLKENGLDEEAIKNLLEAEGFGEGYE